jgi:hypothetical protein
LSAVSLAPDPLTADPLTADPLTLVGVEDTLSVSTTPALDVNAEVATLHRDGIVGLKAAFPRDWARQMREDVEEAFAEASARPGGAVGRGPNRYYVEIHPEQLRGFVDLVTHPWVHALSQAVCGPAYQIVELGFDIPFAGAVDQPWHRDFPSTPETYEQKRLTSLAFDLTGVDVTPEMGPFEVAPGTQWQRGDDFDDQMFPPKPTWPRYAAIAQQQLPQMGDVSARSALTIHRGTANRTELSRPVLVLGVDAPGAGHAELHDTACTRRYWAELPAAVRAHLSCKVVDELAPITQKHTIEAW